MSEFARGVAQNSGNDKEKHFSRRRQSFQKDDAGIRAM